MSSCFIVLQKLWWNAGKHLNSHGCLLLCTTSFKSIINPQKVYAFRTKSESFLQNPFHCHVKKQATYCCHSQWCIWGVEDISRHRDSLCHHCGATESWGLGSPAMVFTPSGPIAGLTRAVSAAQSMIASWFDSFLAALHWSQNQLNGESDFHRAKQLGKNVLFLLSPSAHHWTYRWVESGRKVITF